MTPPPIPLLKVRGGHREAGAQIGERCATTLRRAAGFEGQEIPEGRSRPEQLALADRYREITYAAYPWYAEEIEGAAEAADVDPRALFACAVEEIWYVPQARRLKGRCTDVVAVAPASRDGHALVGHNNDMSRTYQDELVAIEWTIPGDPMAMTIGNGIWISCGWNDAGLSMTGNQLAPLDERVGIPREVQFRSMLRQPTMERAVGEALRHDRASSYNQVLVSRDGEVVNVEGSATDAELTSADGRGHLVNTNHYVGERMLRYEGDRMYAVRSARRLRRAALLLEAGCPGSITVETLRAILSDHDGAPDCLCRHPERFGGPRDPATAFWWIADVTDMRLAYGRGNPCDSIEQEYVFSAEASQERATA